MSDYLDWLQTIYADDLCNGSWEHLYGITILTLDNPGWLFKFDLKNLDLEDIPFPQVEERFDENNWYVCRVRDGVFEGAGGPKNLTDILRIFQKWYIETSQG